MQQEQIAKNWRELNSKIKGEITRLSEVEERQREKAKRARESANRAREDAERQVREAEEKAKREELKAKDLDQLRQEQAGRVEKATREWERERKQAYRVGVKKRVAIVNLEGVKHGKRFARKMETG